jgi:hypothetical protein
VRGHLLSGLAALVAGIVGLVGATPAWAHGFGARYDLPIPLWLYLLGAGGAVAVSFVIVALMARRTPGLHGYARLDLRRWALGRALTHAATLNAVRLIAVAIVLLIIVAGLFGTQSPTRNFAPTMVWVIWWVGLAFVCALVGNLWALVNPWRILFAWAEAGYRAATGGRELAGRLAYPRGLGMVPAIILFLVFAWLELVWRGGEVPRSLACAIIAYSAVTWAGMAAFGREIWLRHGEAFDIAFGLLARFAPTEVRVTNTALCETCGSGACGHGAHGAQEHRDCVDCYDCASRAAPDARQFNLRPWAVGLLSHAPVPWTMLVFILLMLATVSFDGIKETPAWTGLMDGIFGTQALAPLLFGLHDLTGNVMATLQTLALVVLPTVFLIVYMLFAWMMAAAAGPSDAEPVSAGQVARLFVLSLIPIALAYHLAHYISFLLLAGQLIIPLVSDPFGFGWDLFGTADYRLDIAVVNARMVWYTAVAAIVVGHMVAVYLAHIAAMRVYADTRRALRGQIPMLALMVGYTTFSLWILSQPIVKSSAG